jgi:uncharacterized membrane protein
VAHFSSRRTRSSPLERSASILVVGALLLAGGIILTLLAVVSFFTSVIRFGLGGGQDFGILGTSIVTVIVVGGMGAALSGVGGFLVRFWFLFLIVDVARGNTVAEREIDAHEVKVRCRSCGRLNPQDATYCIACGRGV